jgi:hypothetical protein
MTDNPITQMSVEAELIRQIEELIRKLAERQADQNDVQLLQDLQKRRVDLMRPHIFGRKRISA